MQTCQINKSPGDRHLVNCLQNHLVFNKLVARDRVNMTSFSSSDSESAMIVDSKVGLQPYQFEPVAVGSNSDSDPDNRDVDNTINNNSDTTTDYNTVNRLTSTNWCQCGQCNVSRDNVY